MQQREMLDRMHSDNAEMVRRFARDISARLDALERGEVVRPMIRRSVAPDPQWGDDDVARIGFRVGCACTDAVWLRVDEIGLRVRALMKSRPKPRVRVGPGVNGGAPVPAQEDRP